MKKKNALSLLHLFDLQRENYKTKELVKEEKHRLNKALKAEYPKWFRIMDILLLCVILMNFGAVFMTNFVVEREADIIRDTTNPDYKVVLMEVNPVQAELHGYQQAPGGSTMMVALALAAGAWLLLLFGYIYKREHLVTKQGLIILMTLLVFYFSFLGWDFFNDLGFFLGKVAYGGF